MIDNPPKSLLVPPRTFEPARKLDDATLVEIGQKYINGQSIGSLAKEYGVVQSTINYQVNKHGWRKYKTEQTDLEILDEAILLEECHYHGDTLPDNYTRQDLIDAEAKRLVSVMERHRAEWGPVESIRRAALIDPATGETRKLDEISLTDLKKITEMVNQLHKTQQGERLVWGIEHHERTQAQVAASEATAKAAAAQATSTTADAMARVIDMRSKLINALNTGKPITIIDQGPGPKPKMEPGLAGRSMSGNLHDGQEPDTEAVTDQEPKPVIEMDW